jgi:site-specific recombinase XerD
MSEQSIGLCIFLKRPKNRDRIDRFVYLRITANGKQSEVSTHRSWSPHRWDQSRGRATGKEEDAQALNDLLDILIVKCHNIRSRLLELDREISPSCIKDVLLGIDRERKLLLEVFHRHNEKLRKLVPSGECSKATLQKYVSAFGHTKEFIRLYFRKDDLPLSSLNYNFAEGYVLWLRTERNCCENTAAKYLSNLNKIILYSLRMGWIKANPFTGFRAKKKEVHIIPLTCLELEAITNKRFATERLTFVKDIFIFCCYTGLSYIDVKLLSLRNLQIGDDGESWICTQRNKTGIPVRLPLLPKALEILKIYTDNPKFLARVCISVKVSTLFRSKLSSPMRAFSF